MLTGGASLNSVQKHGEQGWQGGWGLGQEGSSFSIFKVETQLSARFNYLRDTESKCAKSHLPSQKQNREMCSLSCKHESLCEISTDASNVKSPVDNSSKQPCSQARS